MKFVRFFARRLGKTAAALKQRSGRANTALDPEGWQVGDWAECQAAGGWFRIPGNEPAPGPRLQQIARVTGVKIWRNPAEPGGKVLTLAFSSWPGDWFDARQFRKLRPRADEATAAEEAFTDLVRRAPAPAPAPTQLPEHPKIEEFQ